MPSQYTRDLNRYNFVSRKVFDRTVDRLEQKRVQLLNRIRVLEQKIALIFDD